MNLLPILIIEIGGFVVVAVAIWLDELFNVPHRLFGAPLSNFNLHEAGFESLAVLLLGAVVTLITWRLMKRISQLEELLPICMFCKRIRKPDADPYEQASWEPVEQYINERTGARFSHGFCPECGMKHYGEVMRDDK